MGSDPSYTAASAYSRYFNPRSRMGSDVGSNTSRLWSVIFQSTLPHGERRDVGDHAGKTCRFQSTLPHGERPGRNPTKRVRKPFQSTLPHGERRSTPARSTSTIPFQSTLPHGERPYNFPTITPIEVFQSTLPHGERRVGLCTRSGCSYFNPRSRMGSDPRQPRGSPRPPNFNPRSRMGSDRLRRERLGAGHRISIHAPAWGATGMV